MTQPRWRHIALTGASSGLGAALAETYAGPGVRLSLAGRDAARLDDTARICRAKGAEVATKVFDIRCAEHARDWLFEADAICAIDVIYANAGVGGLSALAGPRGENGDAARSIIETNLIGAINTAGPALDIFLARRRGCLVLIGSLAGRLGLPHCPSYSASKAAVAVYADALRRLAKPLGVQVTLVEPGFVRTPMSEGLSTRGAPVWTATKAAAAIVTAVQNGRAVLRFPLALNLVLHLARWLPGTLLDRILSYAFQKSLKR